MISPDSRLVQTAVIGGRSSGRAIILPTNADELAQWRRRHPTYTYWCGTQLGGCGNELSDRLYRDKVCHFAHRPNTSCHRTATGASSADHLFIKDDLAAWAGRQRLRGRATSRNLGSSPGDAVDFRVGDARQHVRFQFSKLPHDEWNETRAWLAREASTLDWVFGPGAAQPETMEELYDEYGYLLRFRFETFGAVRRIRLRAEDPRRSTDWVPLDACAITPDGLRVPGAERRRRSLRPRPAAGPGAAPGAASAARSRDEQVLALKDALVSAARFRTRPTWEALCRSAGSDLLELTVPDRVSLLVAVEQAADSGEGGPLLSALLKTGESGPPSYVAAVADAVGCGAPATAGVLKRWCQRETDRAFAVHGAPSRTAPPRLSLTPDGHIASQGAESPQHRTIVHVPGGHVRMPRERTKPSKGNSAGVARQSDTELRHALRGARERRSPERAAALLKQAEGAASRLPEPQRSQLVGEMAITRRWLAGNPRKPKKKQNQKSRSAGQAKAGKTRVGKKAAKRNLRGARPL
ncbi:competence protein CoiA family protein [Streptomyces sp. NPDC019645]|uniref:competence protein CoiA family protein n=1 Tax=Streptomyces sp. NPDC019645 TaxID=3154786 RepID=UPI0033EAD833